MPAMRFCGRPFTSLSRSLRSSSFGSPTRCARTSLETIVRGASTFPKHSDTSHLRALDICRQHVARLPQLGRIRSPFCVACLGARRCRVWTKPSGVYDCEEDCICSRCYACSGDGCERCGSAAPAARAGLSGRTGADWQDADWQEPRWKSPIGKAPGPVAARYRRAAEYAQICVAADSRGVSRDEQS